MMSILKRRTKLQAQHFVIANFDAYQDGALTGADTAFYRQHLASCQECRDWESRQVRLVEQLGMELSPSARLSPAATDRMYQNLYRRMRRANLMNNIRTFFSAVAAFAIIAIAVGVFIWWQGDSLTTTLPPEQAGAIGAQVQPQVSAVASEGQDGSWHVVNQMQVEHRANFAAFMNEEFGITGHIQQANTVHITSDGGQSWISPETFTGRLFSADIVDVQSIWHCGRSSFNTSKDGGQTWQPLTRPLDEECLLLSFLDDEIGWATSRSKLVATKDGGNNWQEIRLPEEIGKIAAISLRTPEDGYVLDFDRTLYSTDDGGASWSAGTLEIEDSDLEMMDLNLPSAAIRFMDNEHGVVIMNLAGGGKSELIALHTSDGGQTWEHEIVPVGLGALYLSHDGEYLTVTELVEGGIVTLLKYQ